MENYVRKILKIYHETTVLLRIALSPKYRAIFATTPTIEFLPSSKRTVALDPARAVRDLVAMEDLEAADTLYLMDHDVANAERHEVERCLHCECTVMQKILGIWKKEVEERPMAIIGVSKLACQACRLYFSAYELAVSKSNLVVGWLPYLLVKCSSFAPESSSSQISCDRGSQQPVQLGIS